jgi:hypothetical protein
VVCITAAVWEEARGAVLISSFLLLTVVSHVAGLLAVIIKIILITILVFVFLYLEELIELHQVPINCRSRCDC